jgi:hypothetical protein
MQALYNADQLAEYSHRAGFHFFDKSANRFFNSRTGDKVVMHNGAAYFVTSERFDDNTPRMYTARRMLESGAVEEVPGSKFQQFSSARSAWAFTEKYMTFTRSLP